MMDPARCYVGFPPHSGFLVLPARPSAAFRSGLALYEAVLPRQRAALGLASLMGRCGLAPLLPTNAPEPSALRWWSELARQRMEPQLGPIAHLAFRLPPNPRDAALMIDREGSPVAFVKTRTSADPMRGGTARSRLTDRGPRHFFVPAPLGADVFDGVQYEAYEPLPAGPHRPPPRDPDRVHAMIDEYRDALAPLSHAHDPAYVPVHNDLTPRNVRVAQDGTWWVLDWEELTFGPPLVDEARYWIAAHCYRHWAPVAVTARRVLRLLRTRGTDEEISEALAWEGVLPARFSYLERENEVRRAITSMVGAT